MNKSKNSKLNNRAVLDESLGFDKVPVELEYDLPDGSIDEPIAGGAEYFYTDSTHERFSSEADDIIDEMIDSADADEGYGVYFVENVQNERQEDEESVYDTIYTDDSDTAESFNEDSTAVSEAVEEYSDSDVEGYSSEEDLESEDGETASQNGFGNDIEEFEEGDLLDNQVLGVPNLVNKEELINNLDLPEDVKDNIRKVVGVAETVDDEDNLYGLNSDSDANKEFNEMSASYATDSLNLEEKENDIEKISSKIDETSDDLSDDVALKIAKEIHGEDFAKNFDLPEDLLEDIKNAINESEEGKDINKLLGGVVDPNLVQEIPIFESAKDKILKEQLKIKEEEENASSFMKPDVNDTTWLTPALNETVHNQFDELAEEVDNGEPIDYYGDLYESVDEESNKEELPMDEKLPEFLKTYIDKDLLENKNESEKQGEPAKSGEEKMDDKQIKENENDDKAVQAVASVVQASSLLEEEADENAIENKPEVIEEETVVVKAKDEEEAKAIVNEQIKKTVGEKAKKSSKDGVVRVRIDDGSVICDVCGHLNRNASGVCEMCSNYLKVRR